MTLQSESKRSLNVQDLLANPLVVLASQNPDIKPRLGTSELLWVQAQRNELGVALCDKYLAASTPEELARSAQDIAYIRGKLDMLRDLIEQANLDTSVVATVV